MDSNNYIQFTVQYSEYNCNTHCIKETEIPELINKEIQKSVIDIKFIDSVLKALAGCSTVQENKIEKYFYKQPLYGQKIVKEEFGLIKNKIIYANNLVKQKFLQQQRNFISAHW